MNSYASPVGIIRKDIYIIRNNINTKVYIGQALDTEKRFKSHCKGDYDNSLIDKAIQNMAKNIFGLKFLNLKLKIIMNENNIGLNIIIQRNLLGIIFWMEEIALLFTMEMNILM